MRKCKYINDDYLCPFKFTFELIKSNHKKSILIFIFNSFIWAIFIVLTFILFIFNEGLGIFFLLTFGFLLVLLTISHFVYIAKIFSKTIDEALIIYNKTPFYNFFDNLGTAFGILLGYNFLSILFYLLSILLFFLSPIIIIYTPMIIGYTFLSKNFSEGFKRPFYYFNIKIISSSFNKKYFIYLLMFITFPIIIFIIFPVIIYLVFIILFNPLIFSIFDNFSYGSVIMLAILLLIASLLMVALYYLTIVLGLAVSVASIMNNIKENLYITVILNTNELKKKLYLEKDEKIKMKLIFLNSISEQGINLEKACQMFGIPISTGRLWVEKWNKEGYEGLKNI